MTALLEFKSEALLSGTDDAESSSLSECLLLRDGDILDVVYATDVAGLAAITFEYDELDLRILSSSLREKDWSRSWLSVLSVRVGVPLKLLEVIMPAGDNNPGDFSA